MANDKGLGDTVERFTEFTGIKKVVKWIAGEDCGCNKRKEKLNKIFPYKKAECLTEEEYNWCKDYFETYRSVISRDEQHKMLDIHNRVFKTNKQPSSCSSCVKDLYNEVKKLYDTYND